MKAQHLLLLIIALFVAGIAGGYAAMDLVFSGGDSVQAASGIAIGSLAGFLMFSHQLKAPQAS